LKDGVPYCPKNPIIPSTDVPNTKMGNFKLLKLAGNLSQPVVMIIIDTGTGNGVPGMMGMNDTSRKVEII
jgi:hypothetical protein